MAARIDDAKGHAIGLLTICRSQLPTAGTSRARAELHLMVDELSGEAPREARMLKEQPRARLCRHCALVSRNSLADSEGHMKRQRNVRTARVCWNSW